MREPHPQSHVTLRYRGHVTNKNHYISTFTRPVDSKLSSVVAQDEEISSKSHMTHHSCGHVTNQKTLSLLSQGLWTPNLADWWLKMTGPTHKFTWQFNIVVTWQIKNVISPLSQDLWILSLASSWLKTRQPPPTNSRDTLITCLGNKSKTFYLHIHKPHGPQNLSCNCGKEPYKPGQEFIFSNNEG